jgi:RHS repeat-associated protein
VSRFHQFLIPFATVLAILACRLQNAYTGFFAFLGVGIGDNGRASDCLYRGLLGLMAKIA